MREIYVLLPLLFLQALAIRIPCRYDSSIRTLEDLVNCFEQYTVPEGYYTSENAKHCSAQPNEDQLTEWRAVVQAFWAIDLGKPFPNNVCQDLQTQRPVLANIYEGWIFRDGIGDFCVLSEMYTDALDRTVYSKGWGLMVVPLAIKTSSHVLHLSVPRPLPGMAQYAATVFKSGIGRSLLINGRHPRAIRHSSSCVQPTDSCQVFHKTDAVYDKVSTYLRSNILETDCKLGRTILSSSIDHLRMGKCSSYTWGNKLPAFFLRSCVAIANVRRRLWGCQYFCVGRTW